mgnify:CR=1 FL=1
MAQEYFACSGYLDNWVLIWRIGERNIRLFFGTESEVKRYLAMLQDGLSLAEFFQLLYKEHSERSILRAFPFTT